jgi:D-arabinose 5-phosphate isomerase GutQ|tara:strand:+ start:12268 stop:12600 length:333 start_codon:yes stop_codon:yes gene_type:complete
MGRYISTTGTASSVIRTVNTTYSAIVNDRILADSSGSGFTITLPANASLVVNDTISVIDVTGNFNTNNVTLARNGSKIQNLSENLVLDINNVAITLIYSGSTYGWIMSGT